MAAGTLSDFVIDQEQFFGGLVETATQNADVFNEASRMAIRLVTRAHLGEYEKESFFQRSGSRVSRRDPSATTAVNDGKLTQEELIRVKLNRRLGPDSQTRDAFRKIGMDPAEISAILGEQYGPDVMLEMVNSALRSARAALEGQSDNLYDATDGTIQTPDLTNGLRQFGDKAQEIGVWVAHSKVAFDLLEDQQTNLQEIAGFTVIEGNTATLGRPMILSDSDALITVDGVTTGTDEYHTLGLVSGGVEVLESEEREVVSDLVTGEENIRVRIQGEYAFSVGVRGFKWDTTNGGTNPTDSALGTSTNWDKVVEDKKSLAGVIINSQ